MTFWDLFSVLDCFCGTAFKTGLCDVFLVDVGVWILDAVEVEVDFLDCLTS